MGRNTDSAKIYSSLTYAQPSNFNVCTNNHFPQLTKSGEFDNALTEVLIHTPIPGLGDGLGALPRFRSDSASSNKFANSLQASTSDSVSAAIPARTGLSFRFRMPFYLVPTDLFWLSPLYHF